MANKLTNELTLKDTNFTSGLRNAVGNASKQLNQLGKVGSGLGGTLGSLGGSIGTVGSTLSGVMSAAGPVGAAIGAMTALSGAISNNIETARNFEKAMSQTKAITGASAETMNQLKNAAIELGATTTQSASGVMSAFQLIGSKSPDLLKNADALAEVTEYTIMLSEAAQMELEPAATALTGILNQFSLSSTRAKEVVNMLAAASQMGAGDVEYLNSAIKNCGSVAGALNVPVNQVVAVIEQLAQAGVDASSAGNNLKNIMLTLESSTNNNLKPSVVGLVQAIQNLADKNLTATEMSKMFGKENVASALTLVKTAESADKLTKAITGTNTAEEQQKINNDNLDGSLKALESRWEAFNLAINEGNGIIRTCVDWTASLVGWLTELIKKTDSATEARKKFNKEFNTGASDGKSAVGAQVDKVKNAGSKGKSIGEHNKTMAQYRKAVADYDKQIKKLDEDIKAADAVVGTGMDNTENAVLSMTASNLRQKRKVLQDERKALVKDWNDFKNQSMNYLKNGDKKPEPTNTTTTTTTTTTHTTPNTSGSKGGKVTNQPTALAGSLNDLKAQYNKLQQDLSDGLIPADKIEASKQKLQQLKSDISNKEIELGLSTPKESDVVETVNKTLASVQTAVEKKPVRMKTELVDARTQQGNKHEIAANNIQQKVQSNDNEYNNNTQQINVLNAAILKAQAEAQKLNETLNADGYTATEEETAAYNSLTEAIAQAVEQKERLAEINSEIIDENQSLADTFTKETKKVKNNQKAYNALGGCSDALNSLGGAVSNLAGDNQGLQAFGIALYLAGAMAAMAQQLTKCVTVWDYIAAVAAGTAAVATSVVQFKQLGAHASGGFVSGGPTVGDKTLIRANRGELVLNSAQQQRLWKQINGSTPMMNGYDTLSNVEFTIRGKDLVGTFDNYNRKKSKM